MKSFLEEAGRKSSSQKRLINHSKSKITYTLEGKWQEKKQIKIRCRNSSFVHF